MKCSNFYNAQKVPSFYEVKIEPDGPGSFLLSMDIGHGTLIAMWVTFGVASLLFWARLLVQINIVKRLGRDDYLMLAAWVSMDIPRALVEDLF